MQEAKSDILKNLYLASNSKQTCEFQSQFKIMN